MNDENLYPIWNIIMNLVRPHTKRIRFARYRRFFWLLQADLRRTQVNAGTLGTAWLAGDAILPTEAYPLTVYVLPQLAWQKRQQILLDFARRLLV